MTSNHLLYSFRRCPYAMRARMALVCAGIQCEVYEVDFKDKPAHLLEISPKGTVPVLQTPDGQVIEESLDLMHWALAQNDPEGWLDCDPDVAGVLITENDGPFKRALDRYKYPGRYPEEDCSGARETGLDFLKKLNDRIAQEGQILGTKTSLADIAIFPFIRQYAHVDRDWFEMQDLKPLQKWLSDHLESPLFTRITQKQQEPVYSLLS